MDPLGLPDPEDYAPPQNGGQGRQAVPAVAEPEPAPADAEREDRADGDEPETPTHPIDQPQHYWEGTVPAAPTVSGTDVTENVYQDGTAP